MGGNSAPRQTGRYFESEGEMTARRYLACLVALGLVIGWAVHVIHGDPPLAIALLLGMVGVVFAIVFGMALLAFSFALTRIGEGD